MRVPLLLGLVRSPPPEVVALGPENIISYLAQLMKGEDKCFRLKLMFVGQENVGFVFRLCLLSLSQLASGGPSRSSSPLQSGKLVCYER